MNARTLVLGDSGYPVKVAAALGATAPAELRVRGAPSPEPVVVIVGSRDVTDAGYVFARDLAMGLVDHGFAVWSGGARGIDAAAHEGALEAGGSTVAVLGGGLGSPFPAENRELFEQIVESGGALVSLVDDESPPSRAGFFARNRVLAAAACAVVIVEARLRSGARHTASVARELGRALGVVPRDPWIETGLGCAAELAAGGVAVVTSVDDAVRLARAGARGEAGSQPRPGARRPARPPAGQRALQLAPIVPLAREPATEHARASTPAPARVHAQERRRARVAAALASLAHSPARDACYAVALALDERRSRARGEHAMHVDEICERTSLPPAVVSEALLTLTLGAVVVEAPPGHHRLRDD